MTEELKKEIYSIIESLGGAATVQEMADKSGRRYMSMYNRVSELVESGELVFAGYGEQKYKSKAPSKYRVPDGK